MPKIVKYILIACGLLFLFTIFTGEDKKDSDVPLLYEPVHDVMQDAIQKQSDWMQ